MKTMKKLFALLLALAMVLSMAVTVSAEDGDEPASHAMNDESRIIIHGAGAGTTYTVYRILDIASITTGADGKPDVVYTFRTDNDGAWNDFFTNSKYAADYFTIENGYVKEVKFVSESSDPNAKTAQKLAEIAVQYIADHPNLANDGERHVTKSGTQTGSYRKIGMYILISDRTVGEGETLKHNVFTLLTEDKDVYEKNLPVHSIIKRVREDSLVQPNTDSGWEERNAAEIAQPVEFRITVDLAPGEGVYKITDTMPNFDHLKDLTVTYSGADEFKLGTDYTIDYNTETTGFTITLLDNFRHLIEDADRLTINYKACLKSTANISATGNINTATLYHGVDKENNPVKVEDSVTTTYTYKLIVNKVDENGAPLKDAKFVLKAGSSDAETNFQFIQISSADGVPTYAITHRPEENEQTNETRYETIVTDENGKFVLCGLDSRDIYYLVETEAPGTYVLANPEKIEIIPAEKDETFVRTVTITNLPGVNMPETGGMGTTIFYAVGGILVLAAVVLLITKKRMSA